MDKLLKQYNLISISKEFHFGGSLLQVLIFNIRNIQFEDRTKFSND